MLFRSLANHTIMKAIVPGNSGLVVGHTVNINLNSLSTDGLSTEEDEFYSGVYLITAIRHVIQTQGVYQTVLELAKNTMSLDNYSSQAFPI